MLCRVRATGEREVPTRRIGEWVMDELRDLDQVAYVRFASVYRSFQDVNAFREEVERLQEAAAPGTASQKHQLSLLSGTGDAAGAEDAPDAGR
jgi:transcriptional repressor NrdR